MEESRNKHCRIIKLCRNKIWMDMYIDNNISVWYSARDQDRRMGYLKTRAREVVLKKIEEIEAERKIVRINPIFSGRSFSLENDLIFVLLPFDSPFMRLYKENNRPSLEGEGQRHIYTYTNNGTYLGTHKQGWISNC